MSRIGKKSVPLPQGVTAQVKDGAQLLPGDKGTRQVYLGQKLPIKRSTTGTASPAK